MIAQRSPSAGTGLILVSLTGVALLTIAWLLAEGLWALNDLIKLLEQR